MSWSLTILRDYRFYAEDLVHPNYAATNYVWEKFSEAALTKVSFDLLKKISEITAAKAHRPFNEKSEAHQTFRKKTLAKIESLHQAHPYLNLDEEKDFFARSAG